MAERFRNLIDGKAVEAAGGAVFEDLNPANRTEVLGGFPRSDYRDVDRAVEAARTILPVWGATPPPERAAVLFRAAELLVARREELEELIVREMGKVLAEARAEVGQAIDTLVLFAGEWRRASGEGLPPRLPDRLAFGLRAPVGVVGAITSWCSPLADPLRLLAPALIAGNPVVWKPAEEAPLAATRLGELLLEAGLPSAAVAVVHGLGEEAGAPLVRHPDVAVVAFSGSAEVGREIAIACAAERKRMTLDLGGECATLILEDADLERALDGAVRGAFATSGQRRTAAARVVVERGLLKGVTEGLTARVQALRVGDGLAPGTHLGPLINDRRLKRVQAYTRLGVKEGVKTLCGGEALREGEYRKGFYYAPTVFAEATPKMRLLREQALGPTVTLLPVGGLDEAAELLDRLGVRHGVAVFTERIERACRAIERLRARVVTVNGPLEETGGRLPDGTGDGPGWGSAEAAGRALDAFTEWKAVAIEVARRPSPEGPLEAGRGGRSKG